MGYAHPLTPHYVYPEISAHLKKLLKSYKNRIFEVMHIKVNALVGILMANKWSLIYNGMFQTGIS